MQKFLGRWFNPTDALTPIGAIRWWVTGSALLFAFSWIWVQIQ